MASISKQANGRWRASIFKLGTRDTKVFLTKREAESWASLREADIIKAVDTIPGKRFTLTDALIRYIKEVSPTKKGARWEGVRANAFIASKHALFSMKLSDIQPEHISAWRDYRLASVSPGSVLRDLGFVSAVLETARREWRWIANNPMRDVRKPREPDHREVVISLTQIHTMLKELGYARGPVKSVKQAVAVCFLVALRTGARSGELTSLEWCNVRERDASIDGKTGKRDIPLTRKTKRLIEQMRGFDKRLVFGVTPATLDAMFRRARASAGLDGFTFHDSRHTAATWLSKKLDVLNLCKMFGWKNPKMAMVYVNTKATDITDLLD